MFAGWGGFTLGATQAGVDMIWAADHWPLAVAAHALNHPNTMHVCQDLDQANFHAMPDIDILLAGPSCPGHSSAAQPARTHNPEIRGKHDVLRANAWAVIECAEAKRPTVILVENVPQFRNWVLYPCWTAALRALGYSFEAHDLTATDFGVPQRRVRFFGVAVRGSTPLGLTFARSKEAEPAIGPHLDFALGHWRALASARAGVRVRVAKAQARGLGPRFLTQHVTGHPGVALTEAMRTITTKDQWALVDGDFYRPMSVREMARGQGFPDSYAWPASSTRTEQVRGLGNAVPPPVACQLVQRVLACV